MKLSIIIPAMNEEKSIGNVIDGVKKNISLKENEYEIVVVDSSKDKTAEIAKSKGARVVKFMKRGKGFAMMKGVEESKGKIILFMDADGVNPPEYIDKMIEEVEDNSIVLVGPNPKRIEKDVSLHDKVIFFIYYNIATCLYRIGGMKFNVDPLTGYRAMKKKLWDSFNLKHGDFLIESEMNIKAKKNNVKIKQIECSFVQRVGGLGKSKLATNPFQIVKIGCYIVKEGLKLRFSNFKR